MDVEMTRRGSDQSHQPTAPSPMRLPGPGDRVRLKVPVPEMSLAAGQVGRVITTWFSHTAFEVEFGAETGAGRRRALVLGNQIALATEHRPPGCD